MKPSSTAVETLLIVTLLLPFVYLAFSWNQLPARVVSHYNWQGDPDGWMRKETLALLLGGLTAFLYVVLRFLPTIDPKQPIQSANYQKLRVVITLSLTAINGWFWYKAGHPSDEGAYLRVLMAIISLMLAGIGNYITTVKPNWFIGFRTPWTLESDSVWRKTHQLGGRLMVAGGLLGALLTWIVPRPYTSGIVIGIALIVSLIPVVYSYIYYREEKARTLN